MSDHKTEIANINLRIQLPQTAPPRETLIIWVNTDHATWGFTEETKTFFNKADTDYISGVVAKVCAFAKTL